MTEFSDPTIDLDECAREEIRIPGTIQPNGYLMVLDAETLSVIQASVNLAQILGRTIDEILFQPLEKVLPDNLFEQMQIFLRREEMVTTAPLPAHLTAADGQPVYLECFAHKSDPRYIVLEMLIVEDEPSLEVLYGLSHELHRGLDRLHNATGMPQLLEIAANEVRKLSGYDRVVIYQFDNDWNGEVIAEAKDDSLEPFLGLHYPHTDIPVQARQLYERVPVRLLPRADYQPVPVLPALNAITSQALDMSDCLLRSISPVHLEYMQNMGVKSTLTISMLLRGKLWGLVTCHHGSARTQTHWVRSACQLVVQNLAFKIATLEASAKVVYQQKSAAVFEQIIESVRREDVGLTILADMFGDSLCALFDACGVAYVSNDELVTDGLGTYGSVPSPSSIAACCTELNSQSLKYFCTESISRAFENIDFPEHIAGLLAVKVGQFNNAWLFLFRLSQVRVVRWAGNPAKAVQPAGDSRRLSPRKSFELWAETEGHRSSSWTLLETMAAQILQQKMMNLELEFADRAAQRMHLLEQQAGEFVEAVVHDMKNPIIGALRILEMIKKGQLGTTVEELSEILNLLIETHQALLSRIKSVLLRYQHSGGLSYVRREKITLTSVLERATHLCKLNLKSGQTIKIEPENYATSYASIQIDAEEDSLCRVFENLISNAIYNSPPTGCITVAIDWDDSSCQISIKDSGPTIPVAERPHMFKRFWRPSSKKNPQDVLGLYICKKIVEAHGGKLSYKSEREDSIFILRLPSGG